MLMTGLLFFAIVVAVAGLAVDNVAEASKEDHKEPPQGWY